MSDRDGIWQTDISNKAFNLHSDLDRHYMSTNNGTVKLNMSSLTEFGLVDKGKSQIRWADHFMTAQTYPVELEVNSKASSWKRMRHINIQYFFITEWVKKGQCEMRWNRNENLVDSEDIMGSVLVQWRIRYGSIGGYDTDVLYNCQAGCLGKVVNGYWNTVTNQGVCWAFMADCGSDQCFFPSSSGKLVQREAGNNLKRIFE